MPILTIIRGASGSGKSTVAKALAISNNCNYFEADMYFIRDGEYIFDFKQLKKAHAWCINNVESEMAKGADVIVSNTFTKIWEMQPYLEIAKRYGYDTQIVYCQGELKNLHGVPEGKVQQMRDNFEDYRLQGGGVKKMTTKFNPENFEDQESYDAFMLVVNSAEKLNASIKTKDIVFIGADGKPWDTGKIWIVENGNDSFVSIGNMVLAGCCHDESGRIYMEMEEAQDMLKSFQVYEKLKIDWLF